MMTQRKYTLETAISGMLVMIYWQMSTESISYDRAKEKHVNMSKNTLHS